MPKCDFNEVALHIFRTPFYKITNVGLLLRLLNLLTSKYRIFSNKRPLSFKRPS